MIAPGVIYILTGRQNYGGISADLLETRRGIIDEIFRSPALQSRVQGKIQLPIRDTVKHISLTLKEITRTYFTGASLRGFTVGATRRAMRAQSRFRSIINRQIAQYSGTRKAGRLNGV